MKRLWSILLLFLFLLGCSSQTIQEPVNFYYPATDYIHSVDGNLFSCEQREAAELENEQAILNLYLTGPLDPRFENPFPAGSRITQLRVSDYTATIVISDEFAQLTGISLSLGCAAISMTCMELTGTETVLIRAQTQLLDGDKEIVMTRDGLHISSGELMGANENQES